MTEMKQLFYLFSLFMNGGVVTTIHSEYNSRKTLNTC